MADFVFELLTFVEQSNILQSKTLYAWQRQERTFWLADNLHNTEVQPTVRQERNDDSPLLASAALARLSRRAVGRPFGRSSHNQICAKDTQTNGMHGGS